MENSCFLIDLKMDKMTSEVRFKILMAKKQSKQSKIDDSELFLKI